jgi:hypothetical protein
VTKQKDVFLCHAGEDKSSVTNPLVEAFERENISYWYDEAEIKWGDSVTKKVNEGLNISRYVIVILSKSFVPKNWPQRELNAALNLEASSGEVRVLPLIVGNQQERSAILSAYPILNDKSFLSWAANPQDVVQALKSRLESDGSMVRPPQNIQTSSRFDIPMPVTRRSFTQREKDRYLSNAFDIIRDYFKAGTEQLAQTDSVIEADCEEIERYKFVCSFYVQGNIANRCKIWLGGFTSSNQIAYWEGQTFHYHEDNSMHDWLEVDEAHSTLALKASGMSYSMQEDGDQEMLPEQAAEYFWRKAIRRLNLLPAGASYRNRILMNPSTEGKIFKRNQQNPPSEIFEEVLATAVPTVYDLARDREVTPEDIDAAVKTAGAIARVKRRRSRLK